MKSKIQYLFSIWNWFDIFGLTTVFLITTIQMSNQMSLQEYTYLKPEWFEYFGGLISVQNLRIMAAGASFCMLAKFFDWLRLFEGTAFYIMLLTETLNDIRSFIILIIASLMLFGIPMVMIDLNRTEADEIIEPTFNIWFIDMFLNQYKLALGQYNYENFTGAPQAVLCYVIFLAATFFTQITMLNMLIAIMGDSFERVIENRDVNATRIKLNFMNDMAGTVGQRSSKEEE